MTNTLILELQKKPQINGGVYTNFTMFYSGLC